MKGVRRATTIRLALESSRPYGTRHSSTREENRNCPPHVSDDPSSKRELLNTLRSPVCLMCCKPCAHDMFTAKSDRVPFVFLQSQICWTSCVYRVSNLNMSIWEHDVKYSQPGKASRVRRVTWKFIEPKKSYRHKTAAAMRA